MSNLICASASNKSGNEGGGRGSNLTQEDRKRGGEHSHSGPQGSGGQQGGSQGGKSSGQGQDQSKSDKSE